MLQSYGMFQGTRLHPSLLAVCKEVKRGPREGLLTLHFGSDADIPPKLLQSLLCKFDPSAQGGSAAGAAGGSPPAPGSAAAINAALAASCGIRACPSRRCTLEAWLSSAPQRRPGAADPLPSPAEGGESSSASESPYSGAGRASDPTEAVDPCLPPPSGMLFRHLRRAANKALLEGEGAEAGATGGAAALEAALVALFGYAFKDGMPESVAAM